MVFLRRSAIAIIALMSCGLTAVVQAESFYLKDGDRVVFYGDSITDQRLYTVFTETFVVTRFPQLDVAFTHSGWGGDRVTGGGGGPIDKRLQRDVFPYKPSVVTIMLGMNDGGYKPHDAPTFNTYAKGYQHIVDALKAQLPGVRITLIKPSPYDDVTQKPLFAGGYNGVLEQYSQFVGQLARQSKIDTADLNTPVVAALNRAFAENPELAKKIIPDRVHPGPGGHMLMAASLLKAWSAPAVVSEVEIDLGTGKVVKQNNTSVGDLKDNKWTQTDKSLPMVVDWKDPVMTLAINSSDFLDTLDREILKVSGLGAGTWHLKIDGEEEGRFSAAEFASGINLAKLDTPMMKQAAAVLALTRKHTDLHQTRWRSIQVPLENDSIEGEDAVLQWLDKADAQFVQQQRKAALPMAHQFEVAKEL